MKIDTFVVGAFQENSYLVTDEPSRRAILIDPGGGVPAILAALESSGSTLEAIWLTHAHVDHVAGIAELKRALDVPIHVHPADRPLYDNATEHGAVYGLTIEAPPPPEQALSDGDQLRVGALTFNVTHAPGHAPGHVVIHGHGVAFVGDCIFAGSIGRTDLPLSNPAELARTLERLSALPAGTVLYPGHGPPTTIDRELESNPFLNGVARVPGAAR